MRCLSEQMGHAVCHLGKAMPMAGNSLGRCHGPSGGPGHPGSPAAVHTNLRPWTHLRPLMQMHLMEQGTKMLR